MTGLPRSRSRVVAITPVFNRRDLTLACVKSLLEGDLDDIDLEIIVVDDGSSDGTAEALAERFPEVEVIRGDGSLWYSEATNVGIRAALPREPDYFLLFNNDSLFPPATLSRLVACAERYPTSVVGAALVKWDDRLTLFQTGTRWQTSYGGWRTIGPQTIDYLPSGPFPVETLAGNCMLVPAAALRDCGLMNSADMPNFGDSELVARMRRRGWRVLIEPAAHVLCEPNQIPRRLSSMSPPELYAALWGTRTSYHNLKQRHAANLGGAPRRWQAYAATAIFVGRLALKTVGAARRWPNDWPELPLRETNQPLPSIGMPGDGQGRTIVFAWPYTPWGGVQVYMLQLMKAVRERGYVPVALVPGDLTDLQRGMIRAVAEDVWPTVSARDLSPAAGLRQRLDRRRSKAAAEAEIEAIIQARAPADAIIHIDAGPWDSAGLLAKLLADHPVVMTIHTGLPRLGGWRLRLWQRRFAAVMPHPRFRLIAANGEARRSLSPYVSPKQLDRVLVSRTSFDPDVIAEARARAQDATSAMITRLGLAPAEFRIVVGGQFIERKGYRELLEALRNLKSRGVAVACLWITPNLPPPDIAAVLDRPEYQGLIDLRAQADLGPNQADYLAAVSALADAFVLPSHLEGLPLAIVEAMALGIPCISSAINGIPEVVRSRRNGLLVPPHDARALAQAIEALASDPSLAQQWGANAKADIEVHALPIAVLPTLAIYDTLKDGP